MAEPVIHVAATPDELAHEAARRMVEAYQQAIGIKGRFSVALAGGSTPKLLYQTLTGSAWKEQFDWTKVHVYFSDERCVPPEHADSNYRMAADAMLKHLPIPPDNVYRFRGELPPQEAATEYNALLKEQFGDNGCDLVLLGMGEDGHTASLFPSTEALNETKADCVANFVPKLDAWRLTMTYPFINRAWMVMILATGTSKAERIRQVLEDSPDPVEIPIAAVKPELGKLIWLLDAGAAGMDAADF